MLTIIERIDLALAKAADQDERAAEVLLTAADIAALDAAVAAAAVPSAPAAAGRTHRGVPVAATTTFSHVRTAGSARFGYRPLIIRLVDADGEESGPPA